MPGTLQSLHRYPVKSCRGESLERSPVEPWGLAGDRRWMVVDAGGSAITAREHPTLVLTRPELTDAGLRLTHPRHGALDVHTPSGGTVRVDVWGNEVDARPAGGDADDWFSSLLGLPARLVHLEDPTQRLPNQTRTRPTDRVSLADAYPLLLATQESLDALNDLIAAGPLAEEGPVPMTGFRPSVVVRGAGAPWAEDTWRRLRIGAAEFRVVKGCDRCVFTTIDPETATTGKEPIATLARHRRWDGKTWFGMNLVPDTPGTTISVGDEVEVLDADPDSEGPLR